MFSSFITIWIKVPKVRGKTQLAAKARSHGKHCVRIVSSVWAVVFKLLVIQLDYCLEVLPELDLTRLLYQEFVSF